MSEQDNVASNLREKPNRKEPRQISFRVSEAEYSKLQQSAETLNMSVPAFVKKKAQGAKLVKPKFDSESGRAIVRNLSGVANNINQLARQANTTNDVVTREALEEIKRELHEIWQQLS